MQVTSARHDHLSSYRIIAWDLSHCRLGPIPVVAKVGHGAYKLDLPRSLHSLHDVFPITKLTPAASDPIPGRRAVPPPDPVLVDGEEEFEVEKVLNSRMHYNCLEYLVNGRVTTLDTTLGSHTIIS